MNSLKCERINLKLALGMAYAMDTIIINIHKRIYKIKINSEKPNNKLKNGMIKSYSKQHI